MHLIQHRSRWHAPRRPRRAAGGRRRGPVFRAQRPAEGAAGQGGRCTCVLVWVCVCVCARLFWLHHAGLCMRLAAVQTGCPAPLAPPGVGQQRQQAARLPGLQRVRAGPGAGVSGAGWRLAGGLAGQFHGGGCGGGVALLLFFNALDFCQSTPECLTGCWLLPGTPLCVCRARGRCQWIRIRTCRRWE